MHTLTAAGRLLLHSTRSTRRAMQELHTAGHTGIEEGDLRGKVDISSSTMA